MSALRKLGMDNGEIAEKTGSDEMAAGREMSQFYEGIATDRAGH